VPPAPQRDDGYLVFFSRDPVDDALAEAIISRVRTVAGAGWFDDPAAASEAERTTGGYVRTADPEGPRATALLDAAREVSETHGIAVEIQWREAIVGWIERGRWRSFSSWTQTS
jgi:nucleotide-binding universal stress UspA family protein